MLHFSRIFTSVMGAFCAFFGRDFDLFFRAFLGAFLCVSAYFLGLVWGHSEPFTTPKHTFSIGGGLKNVSIGGVRNLVGLLAD